MSSEQIGGGLTSFFSTNSLSVLLMIAVLVLIGAVIHIINQQRKLQGQLRLIFSTPILQQHVQNLIQQNVQTVVLPHVMKLVETRFNDFDNWWRVKYAADQKAAASAAAAAISNPTTQSTTSQNVSSSQSSSSPSQSPPSSSSQSPSQPQSQSPLHALTNMLLQNQPGNAVVIVEPLMASFDSNDMPHLEDTPIHPNTNISNNEEPLVYHLSSSQTQPSSQPSSHSSPQQQQPSSSSSLTEGLSGMMNGSSTAPVLINLLTSFLNQATSR